MLGVWQGMLSGRFAGWCPLLLPQLTTGLVGAYPSPPAPQVLGRRVFSRIVATKEAKEESWMEVRHRVALLPGCLHLAVAPGLTCGARLRRRDFRCTGDDR